MPKPTAVLVEDDPDAFDYAKNVLEDADFELQGFDSVSSALAAISGSDEPVDLFVLDRRLPVRPGEIAADELGDELLREVRDSYPDARVIVFTGHADIPHVQTSLSGGGQFPGFGAEPIDRITVLEKNQSLEFEQHVRAFRDLLQKLIDVEVLQTDNVTLEDPARRAVRRVALEYEADSVTVKALPGGLTKADVFECRFRRLAGEVGTVVVKRVHRRDPLGGLYELLPPGTIATRVATIAGLTGGGYLSVLQFAGTDPQPLADLIASDPGRAVNICGSLWSALDAVPEDQRIMTVEEICRPLIAWNDIESLVAPFGVAVPPGSLRATVQIGFRHCDLHAANVLICGGHAVLIDCDSSMFGSRMIDPVTVLLSTLTHPGSSIRGSSWLDAARIEETLGTEQLGLAHPQEVWFAGVWRWICQRKTNDREFWAIVLAYAARQLQYPDVSSDPDMVDRIIAIARTASAGLLATT